MVGGYLQIYSVLYGGIFVMIMFEMERTKRVSFLLTRWRQRAKDTLYSEKLAAGQSCHSSYLSSHPINIHTYLYIASAPRLTPSNIHSYTVTSRNQAEMAEAQMRHLRALMSNVAHDLKAPVACIVADTTLLREASEIAGLSFNGVFLSCSNRYMTSSETR